MTNPFHFESAESPYNFETNTLFGDRHDLTPVFPLLDEALASITEDAFEVGVSVGYIYDRKGYPTVDLLGNERNRSYGRDRDDLLVQLTYRIASPAPTYAALQKVEAAVKEIDHAKALREKQAQFEVARAALAEAEAAFVAAGGDLSAK